MSSRYYILLACIISILTVPVWTDAWGNGSAILKPGYEENNIVQSSDLC